MSQKDIEEFFDGLAPKWDSMEEIEDRDIIALLDEVKIPTGVRVLDLGCGTGRITSLLHEYTHNDIYGLDVSSKMIEIAKEKYKDRDYAHFLVGDFLSYKTKNPYDLIIIYNAYPHFVDTDAFKESLKRNLKANGRFAIIHSLSRSKLAKVHNDMKDKITRVLSEPSEEAKVFLDSFRIDVAKEDDHSYLIIGTKL